MRPLRFRRTYSLILAGMLVAVGSAGTHAEPSPELPLGHWAYDFLDRLETRQVVRGLRNGTKPFTRLEVARILLECRRSRGYENLFEVDRQRFEELEAELSYELSRLDQGRQDRGRRHLYAARVWDSALFCNPILSYRWTKEGSANIARWDERRRSNGLLVYGYATREAAFSAHIRDNRVWGSTLDELAAHESPERGIPLYRLGPTGKASIDYYEPDSHLAFSLPFADAVLGIGANVWGPGYTGTLGLSDNAPSYPEVKLSETYFRGVRLTWIHASLDSGVLDSLRTYHGQEDGQRKVYRPKYLAAHRLEVTLIPGLDLGVYESIVYGDSNEGLALMYWLPLTFLVGSEGLLRDTGNKQFGLDVDANLIPRLKLYGGLHVDDIALERMFDDERAANIVGFQLGGLYLDPFGLRDWDLRVEYTRLNPWVYDHKYPTCTFYSYDSVLGYWLERNGDDVFLEARWRPRAWAEVSGFLEQRRKGDQGTPQQHYSPPAEPFLFGQVAKRRISGVGCSLEPLRDFWVRANYQFVDGRNLPTAGGEGREDRKEHVFELGVGYNYW